MKFHARNVPVMSENTTKTKNRYGPPEKPHYLRAFMLWGFIIAGIAGIIWMIVSLPREKPMVCRSDVPNSLIGWGTCSDQ
jgi:hypothetical protein